MKKIYKYFLTAVLIIFKELLEEIDAFSRSQTEVTENAVQHSKFYRFLKNNVHPSKIGEDIPFESWNYWYQAMAFKYTIPGLIDVFNPGFGKHFLEFHSINQPKVKSATYQLRNYLNKNMEVNMRLN